MSAVVLLAEDNRDVRLVLRMQLEPLYQIVEAADGLAAWRHFESRPVDAVVLDLGIPGINGLDLVERIRAHPERGNTPIIVVTGAVKGEELPGEFWRMGTGADAFFEKPVDGATLRAEIDRLLKERANYKPLPPGKGYYD